MQTGRVATESVSAALSVAGCATDHGTLFVATASGATAVSTNYGDAVDAASPRMPGATGTSVVTVDTSTLAGDAAATRIQHVNPVTTDGASSESGRVRWDDARSLRAISVRIGSRQGLQLAVFVSIFTRPDDSTGSGSALDGVLHAWSSRAHRTPVPAGGFRLRTAASGGPRRHRPRRG